MRLNLGCGGVYAPGWWNVDRVPADDSIAAPYRMLDIVHDPWPWPENSCEGIVIHHVLDLLTQAEMIEVLRRCVMTLEPGRTLRMSGADLDRGIHAAFAGEDEWFAQPVLSLATGRIDLGATVGFFLLQGGARKQWLRPADLMLACREVGFSATCELRAGVTMGEGWITSLDSRPGESWFVECVR